MPDRDALLTIVREAVAEFNRGQLPDERIPDELDAVLFGEGGRLDSMDLVGLVTTVEQKVQDGLSRAITLADERAFSRKRSPFRDLNALTDYLSELLSDG